MSKCPINATKKEFKKWFKEQFIVKDPTKPLTTCLLWPKAKDWDGYGRVWDSKTEKTVAVHRKMWELENGKIPKGLLVLHHCDNPMCARIEHLFLGTSKDNAEDMVGKNRQARNQGVDCGRHKLTEQQVYDIRHLRKTTAYTQEEISKMFGISRVQISRIENRIDWAHLPKNGG